MEAGHFYQRIIDPQGEDSLAKIGRWITPGARVLEIGPGSGYFTKYLTKQLKCIVDAVDRDAAMAEHVKPWCRHFILADLNTWNANDEVIRGKYQYIVLADVLEHLYRPEELLEKLKPLLDTKGHFLISVPNMAYAGLIADLTQGKFVYRDEGILDRTHVHFFTRHSLFSMLEALGLHVWRCEGVSKPLNESEFDARYEQLTLAMRQTLAEMPDAFCYQWVIDVCSEKPPEPLLNVNIASDVFPIRIFWSETTDSFCYKNSAVVWGEMRATQPQIVELTLPDEARGRIRIRLTDRPGFFRIYSAELFLGGELTPRRWEAAQGASALIQGSEDVLPGDIKSDEFGRCYLPITVRSGESWINVPESLTGAENEIEKIRIEFVRPISADYQAAADAWTQIERELQKKLDDVRRLVAERDLSIDEGKQAIMKLEEGLAKLDQEYRNKCSEALYRQSLRWWCKLPIFRLKAWLGSGGKRKKI